MRRWKWLDRDAVLTAHEVSLDRFGGMPGIRDEGLLDSALARPQILAHDAPSAGVARLAASYAFGIARNRPFINGNKRIAFLAAYMFLRHNGWRFKAGQAEVVVTMLGVAAGSLTGEQLAGWFAGNIKKASAP